MSVDYAQLKLQHEYWCCGVVEFENEEGVKRVVRLPAARVLNSFLFMWCGKGRKRGVLSESTQFHPRLAVCACMRLVLG
jgi:hypothetical protein